MSIKAVNRSCRSPFPTKQVNRRQHRLPRSLCQKACFNQSNAAHVAVPQIWGFDRRIELPIDKKTRMRVLIAIIVAFGTPSLIACFINTEIVPVAAVVGFTGTMAFIVASLIDKGFRAGCLIRGTVLASPLALALLASILAGTEAKGMMLIMCFFLFAGCCSAAVASLFIPIRPDEPEPSGKS